MKASNLKTLNIFEKFNEIQSNKTRDKRSINQLVCQKTSRCTYDFDISAESLANLGVCKFPLIEGQNFTYEVQSGNMSFNALSEALYKARLKIVSGEAENLEGGRIVSNTGTVAYEVILKTTPKHIEGDRAEFHSSLSLGGALSNGLEATVNVSFSAGNWDSITGVENPIWNQIKLTVVVQKFENGKFIQVEYIETPVIPLNELSGEYQRIGVYLNQDTKQVGYTLNGFDQGYIHTLPATWDNIFFSSQADLRNVKEDATLIGEEFSIELVTDHRKMKFKYPKGTTDLCGNVI